MKVQRGLEKAAAMLTGLNDARCVVWAIGEFFFFLSMFFYILTTMVTLKGCNMHSTRRRVERKDWEEPTKRKTGPNDAIRIV